ncbi:Cysteine-type peptidase [Zea mays]|uniref:Cysteine-type peptidase n=1 Tax=Zea mays TaxID=4577 RepID=A0A1D6H1H3_MAIZE|nr:Cysteine-type peptidase [Zea mays]
MLCFLLLQFRALADQIFRNPDYHKHVRKAVVKQLKEFRKHYEGYVPMEYKVYLKKMKRSGEWGDHVTLQAAADRVKNILSTGFGIIYLVASSSSFEDLPTRKTKKKHWLF